MGGRCSMTFDYNVYHRQNCIVPLILLAFVIVWIILIVIPLLKKKKNGSGNTKIRDFLFILFAIPFLIINSIPLMRGGIHLLYEKESVKIQVSGVIEKTEETEHFIRLKYDVENNQGYGEAIVVNGIKYYLMTYGDFSEGDQVDLDVLPRSRFVLKIEKAQR